MKISFFSKNKGENKTKKYHIITLGCQMNKSDSERISTVFEAYNCIATKEPQEADFVVFNTCSVKQSAENSVYSKAKNLQKLKVINPDLKLIITGCMAPRKDATKKTSNVDLVINIKDITSLPEKLGLLKGSSNESVKDYFSIAPKHTNFFQVYIPIGTGCNNFCTFCVVPYTRGREYSRPIDQILSEVKLAISNGAKEITLLGQNVNSYEYGFTNLLKKINDMPGDFWVRFVSSNPQDMSIDLLDTIAQCDKLSKYIHFAVQSGNDRILKKMNRRHTIQEYVNLCDYMKKTIPNLGISTDIIVGFPSESEDEFNDTVTLMERIEFDMAYISQYSARSGTPAWRMKDDVSNEEKKRRDKILTEVLSKTAKKNSKKIVGKNVKALIEKVGRRGMLVGKDTGFRTVSVLNSSDSSLIGRFVDVKITNAFGFGLEGELLNIYE